MSAKDRCSATELKRAFAAIATAPRIGRIYSYDGAGGGTIADHNQPSALSEHVHHILECEGKSVPLLIRHLDSSHATTATIDGHPVSLGFVSLDLLDVLTRHPSAAAIEDCETDGLCACSTRGYCFDPFGLPIRDDQGDTHPCPTPTEVKKNWEQLYLSGSAHFEYPDFFEGQYYLVKAVSHYKGLGYPELRRRVGVRDVTTIGPTATGKSFKLDVLVKEHEGPGDHIQVLLWLQRGGGSLMAFYFSVDSLGNITDAGGI